MAKNSRPAGADGADAIPAPLARACDEVRLAGPADAVGGVPAALVAAPATTGQASAVLAAAAELGLTVIPRGNGSKLAWGSPPERADLIVETSRLDRVIEHAAGDLVATVEAGVGLDRLAEVLAKAGQRLALDPPVLRPAGTVGGLVATGVAGPLRLRYGTPRDLLIGMTVVRADGTVARSGGKVVKNVAGYDLGKLFAGSRGTLGLITEATFRLHPLPAAAAYVTIKRDSPADVDRLVGIGLRAPIAPVAAELDWPARDAPVQLCLALEGDPDGVRQRAAAMASQLAECAGSGAEIGARAPGWWGGGAAARQDGTVLQIAFWPGDLGTVLAEIATAADQAGLRVAISGSAAGLLHAWVPGDAAPASVAALVSALRSAIGHRDIDGSGGQPGRATVVVRNAPAEVGELAGYYGPVPSLGLMRAVKQQFDPARMMSPGRFTGGI